MCDMFCLIYGPVSSVSEILGSFNRISLELPEDISWIFNRVEGRPV